MVGYNSGGGCVSGSNNTFLGANTQLSGATYDVGSIALGSGATINKENQLMVPLVKNQWNCCSTYRIGLELVKVGPYRAVMGCREQDHKRAGQSRRSIFSFLSQAHQEAYDRILVTTTKTQRTQVETPEDRLATISVAQLHELFSLYSDKEKVQEEKVGLWPGSARSSGL